MKVTMMEPRAILAEMGMRMHGHDYKGETWQWQKDTLSLT